MPHLLALNCGSSSIKGKLFALPALKEAATLAVSNIGSKGDKVTVTIRWTGGEGEDVDTQAGAGEEFEHKDMFPLLLKHMESGVRKEDIKYITHRIVHGGTNTKPLVITRDHEEALQGMDALSDFAPLHPRSAGEAEVAVTVAVAVAVAVTVAVAVAVAVVVAVVVVVVVRFYALGAHAQNTHAILGVRACLDVLPEHTGLLVFDTLFHQTLPPEVYTYALPPPEEKLPLPLRKYGFHGLSYASVLDTLAKHERKPTDGMNLVVAHLGSGASAACILHGKSIDTSMGLTPLEGLVGGTRAGTIDPTAIFHHTEDYAADAGLEGMHVTKAEWILNKKSGLTALAGTQNFSLITSRLDPSTCSKDEHAAAKLAYDVFLDRLMGFVAAYLAKLLASVPLDEVRLVFAGGIGEHSARLRQDVLQRLAWLGAASDERGQEGKVRVVSAEKSKLKTYVIETDEEGWCAHMAKEQFKL